MSMSNTTRRLSRLGIATAAALAIGVLTVPLTPAQAHGWVGVNLGPFAFGIGTPGPYYPYPYYPYPYYYYPPYPPY
jgi:hypothetical protein